MASRRPGPPALGHLLLIACFLISLVAAPGASAATSPAAPGAASATRDGSATATPTVTSGPTTKASPAPIATATPTVTPLASGAATTRAAPAAGTPRPSSSDRVAISVAPKQAAAPKAELHPIAGASRARVRGPSGSGGVSPFDGSVTTVYASSVFSWTLTILNPDGSVDTQYNGTVHFSSSDPNAILPADYTYTSGDAGVHTFQNLVVYALGSQSLTISGTQGLVTTNPALQVNDTYLSATWLTTSGSVGVANTLGVQALTGPNGTGSRLTYVGTIQFTSTATGGQVFFTYTFVVGDQGAKVFNITFNVAGSWTVTVTDQADSNRTATSPSITVVSQTQQQQQATSNTGLDYSGNSSDPVQTLTGSLVYHHTDLAIPGRGPSPTFVRTYQSGDARTSALGPGWTHNYNVSLAGTGDGTGNLLLNEPDGRTDLYAYNSSTQTFSPPPAVYTALVRNQDGTFTATLQDQTVWSFDTSGRLTKIADRFGNASTLTTTARASSFL